MVRVLASWADIGKAIRTLHQDHCYHSDPLKNWDLAQIGALAEELPKTGKIMDAGCSESHCSVLRFLRKKGFKNLVGMDLRISFDDRVEQLLLMKKERTIIPPFKLLKGNIIKTPFADKSFAAVFCLSVIEHGVDIQAFMREMSRLLQDKGILYVSTDYWQEKIESADIQPWGLKWTVFSSGEIEEIIRTASKEGLKIDDASIPGVKDPIVEWSGREYTFLSMVFRKTGEGLDVIQTK